MKKDLVIRQDRITSADQDWVLEFDNYSLKITNYSIFGIACVSSQKIDTPIWNNCTVSQSALFKISDLHFKVVRVTEKNGEYEYGLESTVNSLPVSTMKDIVSVSNFVKELTESQKQQKLNVPESIRLAIYEMKEALIKIDSYLGELTKNLSYTNFSEKHAFEENTIRIIGDWLLELIRVGNSNLNSLTEGLPLEKMNASLIHYRETLREYIYQSVFAERCLSKPLGYAGDYEMMNLVYRNENFGNSLFARCIEYAMQKHPEPQAVRNRAEYLAEKIISQIKKNPHSKIISIASGPAFEVQIVIERLTKEELENVTFILLDQDIAALKNSQFTIKSYAKRKGIDIKLELLNLTIKNVITTGLGQEKYDLIYSAGLFDYFQDEVAKMAAKRLLDASKKDGTVIIGNFDTKAPNKFGMKIVFDWDLIYRSEENLKALYKFTNVKIKVENEKNKINLFCVLEKELNT